MSVADVRRVGTGSEAGQFGVPDAVKPPPGHPRFPLIDGVRALAVLGVVSFHATATWGPAGHWWSRYASHLDVGVTIFFVLSGFLLYRPFVAARLHEAPRPRILPYLRRRALRIVPAYWLALTLLAIYPGLTDVFSNRWWAYYGILQNYRTAWEAFGQGLPQAWSLCTEVSFYLALPIIAAAASRLPGRQWRGRVRAEVVLLGSLSLAALVFRAAVHGSHEFPDSEWLPGMFDWFALGMAVAVASAATWHRPTPPRLVAEIERHPITCWVIAFGLFLLTGAVDQANPGLTHTSQAVWLGEHLLYGGVALFVALPAVFAGSGGGAPRRLLAHPVMAWLGLVSYGIFLWHYTILSQLNKWGVTHAVDALDFVPFLLIALAVSTAFAAFSYYAVERPLLRLKEDRLPVLAVVPIVFAGAMTVSILVPHGPAPRGRAPRPIGCLVARVDDVVPFHCVPPGVPPAIRLHRDAVFEPGRRIPLVAGSTTSQLELGAVTRNQLLGSILQLGGWAAGAADRRPVDAILIFSAGRFLGAVRPVLPRPDVGRTLRARGIDRFGYLVTVPLALAAPSGRRTTLRLVALTGGTASFLPLDCAPITRWFRC